MGIPFLGVRGLLYSDILKHRPDLLVQDNPFHPGEPVVVAQSIRPDVAVFHALKADRWGNAVTPGRRDDLMMARAARRVVVTAEEIIDGELTRKDAVDDTFLPAIDVDVSPTSPLEPIRAASGHYTSETKITGANISKQRRARQLSVPTLNGMCMACEVIQSIRNE